MPYTTERSGKMEGKDITVTTIMFNAFDRVCQEVFYNKSVEECKLIIWKTFCNTAVLLSIQEEFCTLKPYGFVTHTSDSLSKEKYVPQKNEQFEKFKAMLETGRK